MKNEEMKTGVVYQHPIGYLVIGHVTQNLQLTAHASWVGGTASFVGSMALALGLRVGIVTSAGPEADLSALDGTALVCLAQVGPAQVSIAQVCVPQVGEAQVGPSQVGPFETLLCSNLCQYLLTCEFSHTTTIHPLPAGQSSSSTSTAEEFVKFGA